MSSLQSMLLMYFINSVWQLPVIALATWSITVAARSCGPAFRHRLWVAALFLEVFLPATAFLPMGSLRIVWWVSLWRWLRHAPASQTHVSVLFGEAQVHSPLSHTGTILVIVAAAYLLLLLFLSAQLLWNLHTVRRLRRHATPAVLSPELQAQWESCKQRFNVPDAELATSSAVRTPVTVGIQRKLVLLPDTFLRASGEDFSSAVAHELAHIQRADFAKNLVYRALALPVAYHPLARWTLAQIAETREMICDALAADTVSDAPNYAHFLLRLASTLASQPSAATSHAIGIFDAHTLERRIMYLKHPHLPAKSQRRLAFAAVYTIVLSLACASAVALRWTAPPASAPAPPSPRSTPASPRHQSEATPVRPVRVSADVVSGQIVSRVDPEYPPMARAAGVSGAVVLHAIIGRNGSVKALQVISGSPMLQTSAMEAVRQWVYKPYLLNGNPVDVDTTITVNYMLGN